LNRHSLFRSASLAAARNAAGLPDHLRYPHAVKT
jgi:hypothetical protein